jgi:hypothetical protein
MGSSDSTIYIDFLDRQIVTSLVYVVPEADTKQVVAAPFQAMHMNLNIYFGKGLIFFL